MFDYQRVDQNVIFTEMRRKYLWTTIWSTEKNKGFSRYVHEKQKKTTSFLLGALWTTILSTAPSTQEGWNLHWMSGVDVGKGVGQVAAWPKRTKTVQVAPGCCQRNGWPRIGRLAATTGCCVLALDLKWYRTFSTMVFKFSWIVAY